MWDKTQVLRRATIDRAGVGRGNPLQPPAGSQPMTFPHPTPRLDQSSPYANLEGSGEQADQANLEGSGEQTGKASLLLVGIDIGTSGVRAQAFTSSGVCVAEGKASIATSYPEASRAEQDPADWWHATVIALREMAERLGDAVGHVAGIGLTGQCPTFACLLPSGQVAGPGLLYQDNRALAETEVLLRRFGPGTIHQRTGQAPGPFYVLPKLLWLNGQQKPPAGTTIVQPRDLVGWHMTGRCATDPTHAACTLVYDLVAGNWATDWLSELGLDTLVWPEIIAPCSVLGYVSAEVASVTGLTQGTPVIIGAADSICAAYGAGATRAGVLCEVTGTSTCLHLTIEQPAKDYEINTYPHIQAGAWCAELGLNTTGGAFVWLATLLEKSYEQLLREAAEKGPGASGLYFLPHLSGGERDDPYRQGAFIGLQLGHTAGDMTRALLEGIAYALRQRVEILQAAGESVTSIISCGGASRSPLWAQVKADILGLPISVASPADTTVWGAALIASQTLDIPVTASPVELTTFQPAQTNREVYAACYKRFCHLETLLSAP